MKVLIIGGGGREHAIVCAVRKNPKVTQIYCAPGNAGISRIAECVPISAMDFDALSDFALKHAVDLTIVGMDDPLAGGIADHFMSRGLRVFGPRANAAIIEGSKAFSKDLMKKYGIPTAAYETFRDAQSAQSWLENKAEFPVVLKADGLALGKGVLICESLDEAREGVRQIMQEKRFGHAGDVMVAEEFLTGKEVSVLAFADGKTVRTMTSAQDHKRAMDGDQGLNTGGMGTISPSPFYTKEIDAYCQEHIFTPTVKAMAREGRPFTGILFFGLILTADGPKVLEYNARFGDPETQVVLPRMKNDLVEVIQACLDEKLDEVELEFEDRAAVCVVKASGGYPGSYQKGFPIHGLERFDGKTDVFCFHAGTVFSGDGRVVTSGGRVLGITALGSDLAAARKRAYEAVDWADFENSFYRHDIGK